MNPWAFGKSRTDHSFNNSDPEPIKVKDNGTWNYEKSVITYSEENEVKVENDGKMEKIGEKGPERDHWFQIFFGGGSR